VPILVQRTSRRRQWLGVAVMAAFIAFGWWISRPGPMPALPEMPAAPADSRSFSDAASAVAPVAEAASAAASATTPADPVPEGLSEAQWKDLQLVLKDHPNRDAELARVAEFVAYESRLQRFQQLSATPATEQSPEARELARTLLEQLPIRIGNGEVSAPEAGALSERLLVTLHPDPVEYERERVALRARLAAVTPPDRR